MRVTAPGTVVAAAALVRAGRMLLVHRHPARAWYPDCWDLVGGHVEPGERPADTVRRECLEEIGVEVLDPAPFPMTVSDPDLVIHAFVVTRWRGGVRNAAPDEHDDLGWFTAEEIEHLVLADPAALRELQDLLGDRDAGVPTSRSTT